MTDGMALCASTKDFLIIVVVILVIYYIFVVVVVVQLYSCKYYIPHPILNANKTEKKKNKIAG